MMTNEKKVHGALRNSVNEIGFWMKKTPQMGYNSEQFNQCKMSPTVVLWN